MERTVYTQELGNLLHSPFSSPAFIGNNHWNSFNVDRDLYIYAQSEVKMIRHCGMTKHKSFRHPRFEKKNKIGLSYITKF